MLDIGCGKGRHSIAASQLGADVVAIDSNEEAMETGRLIAADKGLTVVWKCADLKTLPLPEASFDVVMGFNYLDRQRMEHFKRAVRPGGHFLYETFLEDQREFGWGPSSDDHLLKRGELIALVQPFEVLFAREVVEAVDSRSAAVSSVVALRRE
ncbi:MAG: class I SAM-dependent methyltransferase [Gemmatimonadetes bacterium]|nr:class I SAM-dependent methyltransferase [Gemmatimonadota bacterium]MCH7714658.1 class I SAM-dependent methyltransferase [Gemmatimonadota bacterium]